MTPEIWTILGTGFTLAALGVTGFTLLWRYITAAERRTRADLAAAEKRGETRFAELKADLRADLAGTEQRSVARFADFAAQHQDLAADVKALGGRMHTLEVQMAKLEGLLEGLREAITGKRAA